MKDEDVIPFGSFEDSVEKDKWKSGQKRNTMRDSVFNSDSKIEQS